MSWTIRFCSSPTEAMVSARLHTLSKEHRMVRTVKEDLTRSDSGTVSVCAASIAA